MLGTTFSKQNTDWNVYAEAVEWCNTNNARIVEYDDCYKVEAIPPLTFEEQKQAKLNNLVGAFYARVQGSFKTSQGYTMQFDTSDSRKMQGAVQLLEATGQTEGYITQADDTTVYHVPLAAMKAVLVEMLAAYAACHARRQELRAQINAAQTEEELNAITIDWPV